MKSFACYLNEIYMFITDKKNNLTEKMAMENNLRLENEKLKRKIAEYEERIKKLTPKTIKKSKFRMLDFSMYKIRRIALKFCYLGWSYCGLAQQRNEPSTVVEKIYEALEMCKLIEKREDSNIVVCGRTDKGVSAYQQVLSLNVRSSLISGKGIFDESGVNINKRKSLVDEEIDYVFLLNKVLPKDIRILAWSPVDIDFSARFNCVGRSYKYIFPKSDLCIESMREAGKLLIGTHDFRNFCSMQINQGITEYTRTIFNVDIDPYDKSEKESKYKLYVIHISASSFIYHQIRCIVAILLLIGQKKEDVEIINDLLDINGVGGQGKPMYTMASDLPLVFHDSCYHDIDWHTSNEAINDFTFALQNLWMEYGTKEAIVKMILDDIRERYSPEISDGSLLNAIQFDMKSENYKPLLKRHKEKTLEEKIVLYQNKKSKDFDIEG